MEPESARQVHQCKRCIYYDGRSECHHGFRYIIFTHAHVVDSANAKGEEDPGDAYLSVRRLVRIHRTPVKVPNF